MRIRMIETGHPVCCGGLPENFNNSLDKSWSDKTKTVGADHPRISIPVVKSYHCRYLGKGRVVVIVSTGESGQTRWKVKSSTTRDNTNVRVVTSVSSRRVVFEKTLADVDSRSTNGVGGILCPTADCRRGWSACCVFCWLLAFINIFSSWGIICVLL